VDLIWDCGERKEKEGGKGGKRVLKGRRGGGKRIDGLKRTRVER